MIDHADEELLALLDEQFGWEPDPAGPVIAWDIERAGAAPARLGDEALLDAVAATSRHASWVAAKRHRLLAAYADRHPDHTRGIPLQRWIPDELAITLSVPREVALGLLRTAQRMVHVLSATLDALERGVLDEGHAEIIRRKTEHLDAAKARRVEEIVLPHAAGITRERLHDRCRRAVAKVDPDGARERHERAAADRRLAVTRTDDDMAELWLTCPAADAQASWRTVDRLARSLGADDPRTLDQRRADIANQLLQGTLAVTDLGQVESAVESVLAAAGIAGPTGAGPTGAGPTGAGPAGAGPAGAGPAGTATGAAEPVGCTGCGCGAGQHGGGHGGPVPAVSPAVLAEAVAQALARKPDPAAAIGRRPLVQVTVALDTLLGGDRPADLLGHGPVPAATARALALGGVWQQLVIDRGTGGVHSVGRRRYRAPAEMADIVKARDRVCRGCGQALHDLDHHQPRAQDGETSVDNLVGYCRRCHVLKDQPGWQVIIGPDLTVTQVSPSGARRTTHPWDYSDLVEPWPGPDPTADAELVGATARP